MADWRQASAQHGTAEGWRDAEQAERRMERLEERMQREPMLERTLDHRIPERQRQIEEPGRGGLSRDRDMDMGR